MASKIGPKDSQTHPGPGAYEDPTPLENTSFSIGRSKKLVSYDSAVPGPGRYEVDRTSTAPSFSFTRSKTLKDVRNDPGPCEYEIASEIGYLPTYSLSVN